MKNLKDIEKLINSEMTTKINLSNIKHNELKLFLDKEDIIEVILFLYLTN